MARRSQLHTFIKRTLVKKVRQDLRAHRIFSEADLQSIVYHHVRRFVSDRDDWLVRCGPTVAGVRPDIVVFRRFDPRAIIQLKWSMNINASRFTPGPRLWKDIRDLRQIKYRYKKRVGKGYLLAVMNSRETPDIYNQISGNWHKNYFFWLPINVHHFRGYERWLGDWRDMKRVD